MSEELEQFNIHMEDIEQVDNLIENISLAVNELKKYTLADRFEVVLNNNLIEVKEKLTNYRIILGCRITYDNLDRNVSFIVREDNKPSYKELEKENNKQKEVLDKIKEYCINNIKSDSFTTLTSGKHIDIEYCIPALEDILELLEEIE